LNALGVNDLAAAFMTTRKRNPPLTLATKSKAAAPAVRVFLGAASENEWLIKALQKHLRPHAEVLPWRTLSSAGEHILESLRRAATSVDFAAFIWGEDDLTVSRKKTKRSPRDNVVYEAGLFAGYLGSDRTFVIHAPDAKVPTDYLGITTIPKDDPKTLADQIKQAMARVGPIPISRIVGSWWQLTISGDTSASVVSFLVIEVQPDSRVISMRGTSWNLSGRPVAEWKCPAAAFDTKTMMLHYSWEGIHTEEENLPTYFGVGEIAFNQEPIVGSFSSASRRLDSAPVIRRIRCIRADANDADILRGSDISARRQLLQQKLRKRATFAET